MNTLCIVCSTPLSGRQEKYCSRKCQSKSTNFRHQTYTAQQTRALARKKRAVLDLGSKCSICGYNKNLAGLVFHHEGGKDFPLDSRSLSNRSEEAIKQELAKCVLLCHNCHMEHHYPHLTL